MTQAENAGRIRSQVIHREIKHGAAITPHKRMVVSIEEQTKEEDGRR